MRTEPAHAWGSHTTQHFTPFHQFSLSVNIRDINENLSIYRNQLQNHIQDVLTSYCSTLIQYPLKIKLRVNIKVDTAMCDQNVATKTVSTDRMAVY